MEPGWTLEFGRCFCPPLCRLISSFSPPTSSSLPLSQQEIGFFDETPTGDITSRLSADTAKVLRGEDPVHSHRFSLDHGPDHSQREHFPSLNSPGSRNPLFYVFNEVRLFRVETWGVVWGGCDNGLQLEAYACHLYDCSDHHGDIRGGGVGHEGVITGPRKGGRG